MNWKKGFNRVWLIVTVFIAVVKIKDILADKFEFESTIAEFLAALVFDTFIAVVIFFAGHVCHLIILWLISGFIKNMDDDHPLSIKGYNPFDIK